MSIIRTLYFWLFRDCYGLLRQPAFLYDLRQSGNLRSELGYLFFRRWRNDNKPGLYELGVVVFCLGRGFVGYGFHLLVFLDGDPDLPNTGHAVRSKYISVGIYPRPELVLVRPLCLKVAV